MALLAVQTLNGLQLGILLFRIAAGLTLTFGVMNFVNLAHGVQYMVGAYLAAMFAGVTGGFWGALALTLPAALAFGLALEFVVFRRLYDRDHLSQILATFGVILFVNQAVKTIWGAAPLSVPLPDALSGGVQLDAGSLYPALSDCLIDGPATALGALSPDQPHARRHARARRRNQCSHGLGAGGRHPPTVQGRVRLRRHARGLCWRAGCAHPLVEPSMGDNLLILAFVVIVIGGIGSIAAPFSPR